MKPSSREKKTKMNPPKVPTSSNALGDKMAEYEKAKSSALSGLQVNILLRLFLLVTRLIKKEFNY